MQINRFIVSPLDIWQGNWKTTVLDWLNFSDAGPGEHVLLSIEKFNPAHAYVLAVNINENDVKVKFNTLFGDYQIGETSVTLNRGIQDEDSIETLKPIDEVIEEFIIRPGMYLQGLLSSAEEAISMVADDHVMIIDSLKLNDDLEAHLVLDKDKVAIYTEDTEGQMRHVSEWDDNDIPSRLNDACREWVFSWVFEDSGEDDVELDD